MAFCVKKLLRFAIALLGLRIALGDIVALGLGTVVIVVVAMAVTVASGMAFARLLGRDAAYGALAGGATAVAEPPPRSRPRRSCRTTRPATPTRCSPWWPSTRSRPSPWWPIRRWAPCSASTTGRPGSCSARRIHDVAQVVGAGYSVSETAGASALIVKLFRVFLLLPVVVGIGWWFSDRGGHAENARVPVPVFALVFLALALLNSTGVVPAGLRAAVGQVSGWGLLVAIAALGSEPPSPPSCASAGATSRWCAEPRP